PGVLWGCPTGTGTIARLALLAHRGLAKAGTALRNTSPSGTAFEATWLTQGQVGEWPSVRARVHGEPTIVGRLELAVPLNKMLPGINVPASDPATPV
ncbi:MAG: proline racemase family protein, partial [Gammaproteobacteria bacterium]|nr:proline racemase family protein [Gammaproteobacteria bacterium]